MYKGTRHVALNMKTYLVSDIDMGSLGGSFRVEATTSAELCFSETSGACDDTFEVLPEFHGGIIACHDDPRAIMYLFATQFKTLFCLGVSDMLCG